MLVKQKGFKTWYKKDITYEIKLNNIPPNFKFSKHVLENKHPY
jgi:hypothetical protein